MCPHLERFNLVDHSLYRILEENYGIQIARSEEEIRAASMSIAKTIRAGFSKVDITPLLDRMEVFGLG